jgi:hypothetical protein
MSMTKQTAVSRANRTLHELASNKYHSAVPLDRIYDAVESVGLTIDPEERACILCGREGRAAWDLFWEGKPAKQALVLTWYKMDVTGRYEVVAYVS